MRKEEKAFMRKLTRRFIIASLGNLNLNRPIRYERYYINDNLRIQHVLYRPGSFDQQIIPIDKATNKEAIGTVITRQNC